MSENELDRQIYYNYAKNQGITCEEQVNKIHSNQLPYNKKLVKLYFPKNKNELIVDLGAGLGGLVKYAKNKGYTNIYGIDRSEEQVKFARMMGIDLRQSSILEALNKIEAGRVNVFILNDVIEHLTGNDLLVVFAEMRSKLTTGGCVIIHTNNAESPIFGSIRYGDLTHKRAYTEQSLIQLMNLTKYNSVKIDEQAPIVHGLKSLVRWLVWKIMSVCIKAYISVETGRQLTKIRVSQNIICKFVK